MDEIHEPECLAPCCPWMPQPCDCQCDCDRLRSTYARGYREGYNAHARAAQHWQDTHGAYRDALATRERAIREQERRLADEWFNQHGQGENP